MTPPLSEAQREAMFVAITLAIKQMQARLLDLQRRGPNPGLSTAQASERP